MADVALVLDDALACVRSALLDDRSLVRAVASGRRRNEVVPYRRVELRYVDLAAGRRLQVTAYDETQAHTRNVEEDAVAQTIDQLLATPYSSWHVDTTAEILQLRVTKKGRPMLHRMGRETPAVAERSHDRRKQRRLDETDALFAAVGMTGSDGTIKPSRMAKFRQVQDLIGLLEPVIDDAIRLGPGARLSDARPLRMVDLGCGNAYLTFAAFRYLSEVRQLPIQATGIDMKAQARARGNDLATALGISDRMRFVEGTISDAEVDEPPDLVLALHACDTATDDALARAVRWQAPVILAAPCCHHDIQRQLAATAPPDRYRLVTRHGILSERLADVLTDALRAAILRIVGYRVEVMEFVDSRHTPRNMLIRAVRTGTAPDVQTLDGYRSLTEEWQVEPALAGRLGHLHSAIRAHV